MSEIVYFPKIYEDELLYSVFARFCEHSGYISYSMLCKHYFERKKSIDVEFFNPMRRELVHALERYKNFEEIILDNTLFKWYARFLPKERRKMAFDDLLTMNGNHKKTLGYFNNPSKRLLKYCPCCVKEDREKYGEAYWHRIHHLEEIEICTIHRCKLIHSDIDISRNDVNVFHSCEQKVHSMDMVFVDDTKEYELAKYCVDMLEYDISLDDEICLNEKIENALNGTKYMSMRTKVKYGEKIVKDYMSYYEGYRVPSWEGWQISKLCEGKIWRSMDIVALSMFLGISSKEICNEGEQKGKRGDKKDFDKEIRMRVEKGESVKKIAKDTNISTNTIFAILSQRYEFSDEKKEDEKLLPIIEDIIETSIVEENGRPRRITKYGVCKKIGIYEYQLDNLPRCKEAIEKREESYEQYWGRCSTWTYEQMKNKDEPFSWRKFRAYTNMRKSQVEKSIPYLEGDCKDAIIKMLQKE